MLKRQKIIFLCFICLLLMFFFSRIIPFIFSEAPLGYDTGLYRGHFLAFFHDLPDFHIAKIANNEPPLLYIETDTLHIIGFTIDFILHGWYFIFNMLLSLLLFIFLRKKYSFTVAVAGFFLYLISLAQFEAYWYLLYKNIIGLLLTILLFYFIEKRSYFIILIGSALAGFHHLSFILLVGTLLATSILDKKNRKFLLVSTALMILGGFFCYLNNLHAIANYLPYNLSQAENIFNLDQNEKTGVFWDSKLYLFYSLWYLPLALIGFYQKIKEKKFDYLFWYFLLSLIVIASQWFFYKRFLIYFDLAAIFLAAPILVKIQIKKTIYKIGFIIWLIFLLIRLFLFAATTKPLLSPAEFQTVKTLPDLPAMSTIISANNYIAPWIYGYSEHHNIWPGKFKNDQWNQSEWQSFWFTNNTKIRHHLLKKYQPPIYIFIPDNQKKLRQKLKNDPAFTSLSEYLWRLK